MRRIHVTITGDPSEFCKELSEPLREEIKRLVWLIAYRRMVKARAERQ